MRDSLTVTPMEPRMAGENVLTAAKALSEIFPNSKTLAALAGKDIPDPETGLKAIEKIEDIRSLEGHLRDAHGCSEREAKAIISKAKSLKPSDSGEDEIKALLAAIQGRTIPQ